MLIILTVIAKCDTVIFSAAEVLIVFDCLVVLLDSYSRPKSQFT